MEWGQQMRQHQENARDAMYHNSNYTNSREKKIPLIFDIEESGSGQQGLSNNDYFNINLMEPLIIDELSDIYLDSCMTMNCKFGNTQNNMNMVIKIDQFNNNTRCASTNVNQILNNALLIPNEFNNLDNHNEMVLHKGKKMNYVCSINPTKLRQFTGKITNLSGEPIFPMQLHYYKLDGPLDKSIGENTPIDLNGSGISASGTLAVDHRKNTTHLYVYVTDSNITYSDMTRATCNDVDLNFDTDSHIKGKFPKIILEFLIVNRG